MTEFRNGPKGLYGLSRIKSLAIGIHTGDGVAEFIQCRRAAWLLPIPDRAAAYPRPNMQPSADQHFSKFAAATSAIRHEARGAELQRFVPKFDFLAKVCGMVIDIR